MPEETKTVHLHVGCRKSGTSTLQLGLKRAADTLSKAGLHQPLGARGGIMGGLVDPLHEALQAGDHTTARSVVAALATTIRTSPQPRHLITLEALAELPAEATSLVVEGLAEFDTHLVVTARSWALTIPSEWQQLVKSRFTEEYTAFAQAVHRPDEADEALALEAVRFRRRQDVADVARRWRSADPSLPVHVILVPQDRHAEPGLTELFCGVLGIRPGTLPVPDRLVNPSLSHEHAEVLRLVNIALGDRLQDTRHNYRHSVRKWIAVRTMMKGSTGSRIRLPRDLEAWASTEARRQVEELHDMGCEVLGDVEGFVHPVLPDDDFLPASDHDVARAAAGVLADLAQGHAHDRRRARKQANARRRRRSATPGPVAVAPAASGAGVLARARRLPRAVAGRLSRRR